MVNSVQYQISLRDMLSSTLNNANRNVNNFDANVDEATQSVMKLNSAMSATGSTANSFMQTSGAMALGTMLSRGIEIAGRAAIDQVKSVISAGLDASKLRAEFATLTGDKSMGEALFGDLNKYIGDSIFGTELFGGAKTLMGFGVEASEVIPILKQLGDVAMGDKDKMQSLTLAFAQVKAGGKLMGGDLLQFVNAGFNPLNEMARTTGKSFAQLKEEMSKGAISSQMVADAFKSATSQGGLFFGMLDKIGETPFGKLQAMQGNIDMAKQQLGEALLPALSDFMDASKPLIEALPAMFRALQPTLKSAIQGFTTLAKWLAKNGELVGNIATGVKLVAEAYVAWRAATVLATGVQYLQNKAIQATILLRGEETVATNAAAAATERLAAAQGAAAASATVGSMASAGGIGTAAMAGGAGLAGLSIVGGALLVALTVGSIVALTYALSDRKGATKYIGSGEIQGIKTGLTGKHWEKRDTVDYKYNEATRSMDVLTHKLVDDEKILDDWWVREGDKIRKAMNFGDVGKGTKNLSAAKATDKKTTATTDPLKADISKVTGQQVRNTYVTINGGLVHEFNVKTQTLKESAPEIKKLVTQVLTDAINDSQITD
jgi:tape measure domain-containing protein